MQEKYRIRSAIVVQLETTNIAELQQKDYTVVDVGGSPLAFMVDGTDVDIPEPVDRRLVVGERDVERLCSGYPMHFYGVMERFSNKDLIVVFEHRLDGEHILTDRANGGVTFDELIQEAPDLPGTEFAPVEVPDWYESSPSEADTSEADTLDDDSGSILIVNEEIEEDRPLSVHAST